MNVYDSIIAGLTEAVEDASSEHKTLKRHTMEVTEDRSQVDQPSFFAVSCTCSIIDDRCPVLSMPFVPRGDNVDKTGALFVYNRDDTKKFV